MAVRFIVRIDGGETVYGMPYFEPGQTISGHVTVEPDTSTECRDLTVRLIWFTEGRGDEAMDRLAETSIYQGRLLPGSAVDGTFSFRLPEQPWSHTGRLVSVVWAIEVNIDVPMAADPNHRERFGLRPRGSR